MKAAKPLINSIRGLFEDNESYQEAKAFLESTPHLSPAYFTLGGVNEDDAAIITSNGIKGIIENLPNSTLAITKQAGAHWVLQTNWDLNDPYIYNSDQDRRVPVGEKCLNQTYKDSMLTSQKKKVGAKPMGFGPMFDVLSSEEILQDITIWTSLMEVKSGKLETWLRNCDPNPGCQPKQGPKTVPKRGPKKCVVLYVSVSIVITIVVALAIGIAINVIRGEKK